MHLIGLDVGTTGCKAIVFDPAGQMLGQAFREYAVIYGEPGQAEQDAEGVWDLTRTVLREAVQRAGVRAVKALSVSVQGDAIIPIDHQFQALHPAILGMDYRSQPQSKTCEETFGSFWLFQRTGMRPHPMNSLVKALWLRERQPRIFEQCYKIVTYADFILGKLGADPVIDFTMASRTMGFDLEKRQWSPHIFERLGLAADKFSRPVPSGQAVGTLRPALAAELGLEPGTLLVTGGHDQPCAAIGSGAVREGIAVASTGTAEVLSTAFTQARLSTQMCESFYPCYLHASPGMYFTFSLNHTGGILLRWYRDNFAQAEIATAAQKGIDPYQLIDIQMPAGPSPVMVLPHHNGTGTPWCDFTAKGAILGLALGSTRNDIAKAILESLTFELLINLQTLEGCGVRVAELVAAGGGAKSPLWLQLKADILRRPIATLRCREAACLGAALLAGTGAGVYASLAEAVKITVAAERVYEPKPDMAARYAERFAVYQQLYPALKTINSKL